MNLRQARFNRNLTQYDLSYLSDVPQPFISLAERGYRTPRPDEIKKLAEALALKPDELEFDTEPTGGKPRAA
jgi:transcriptional regulator with XRE-family HTH domain